MFLDRIAHLFCQANGGGETEVSYDRKSSDIFLKLQKSKQ